MKYRRSILAIALVLSATFATAQVRFNPRDIQDLTVIPNRDNRFAAQVVVTPALSPEQQQHMNVLKRYQVTDLGSLGKLTLQGTVVLQRGMATPDVVSAATKTSVKAATRRQGQSFVPLSGDAMLIPVRAVPGSSATSGRGGRQMQLLTTAVDIPLDTAYLVADWLDLPAGTNIVLQADVRRLVVITNKLTAGPDVTFTYERQVPAAPPSVPPKPGTPGAPAPPDNFSTGHTGTKGTDGMTGAKGAGPFNEAPRAELWVIDMQGSPAVDFRGQDGDAGGKGGAGGDGGNGGQGSAAENAPVAGCRRGPGAGGTGGKGGRGGDGGAGGDGATGGAFRLFAPQPVIAAYAGGGFSISVDPGLGGPGGVPGTPGAPGSGGGLGQLTSRCGTHGRGPGSSGAQGDAGAQGAAGKPGVKSADKPVQFTAITPAEFAVAWLKPAIKTLTPKTSTGNRALEGETVTVNGLHFVPGDTFEIGGGAQWAACPTSIVGDVLGTFVVPATQGGLRSVRLRRQNGVLSNEASLYIAATLGATAPSPRLTPGEKAKLIGTGFTTGMRVRINNMDIGPATFINSNLMEFQVVRPSAGVESNAAGERVKLLVDHNGTTTAALDVVLDTFVIGDAGDSIFGGPGLDERDRIVSVVAQALQSQPGNRAVYVQSFSHTGAKIGITPLDSPGLPSVDRQVPTRYPTVREQVLGFAASSTFDPQYTDLLLISAGANDVGINTWINPETTAAQIKAAVEQASYRDMLALLEVVGSKFPNARVAVAGNYSPLGPDSTHVKLVPLLNAFNSTWYNIPSHVLANLTPAAKQQIVDNCRIFAEEANKNLARAVSEINMKLGGKPRFFFAHPKFGPENAANGAASWVFGIDTVGGDNTVLKPQDPPPVAEARAKACEAVGSPRTEVAFCKRASAGHPNAAGAKAYAGAIVAALK